jgi:tRNA uridine 5-carboxymethylaminomethyl modification enzyme
MLTARAEFRLRLRADNAETRLGQIAHDLGVLGSERTTRHMARCEAREALEELFAVPLTASAVHAKGAPVGLDGARRSAKEWLRFPGVDVAHVAENVGVDGQLLDEFVEDARYAPYLERQQAEVEQLRANDNVRLNADLNFAAIPGLSNEMVEKLTSARPETLGAASRIRGITPAALSAILLHARKSAA